MKRMRKVSRNMGMEMGKKIVVKVSGKKFREMRRKEMGTEVRKEIMVEDIRRMRKIVIKTKLRRMERIKKV